MTCAPSVGHDGRRLGKNTVSYASLASSASDSCAVLTSLTTVYRDRDAEAAEAFAKIVA